MSVPSGTLQALPAPGMAIFPQYLSNSPVKVILKSDGMFSSDMTATVAGSNQQLFLIDSATFSMSHRKTVLDATNKMPLYEISKDGMSSKRYTGIVPTEGRTLWRTETHSKLFHRPRTMVTFANQADQQGGKSAVELEFVPAGAGMDGRFTWNGQQVVQVEKVSIRLDGEYHLTIAPGLDPALVVGVMVAMIDRAKTQSSSSAAAGGAAAAASSGGGGGGG